MSSPTATFFITTARSGTQWTVKALERLYPDNLVVTHEPAGYLYEPRHTLRDSDKLRKLLDKPEIRAHFDHIHRIIQEKSYVEVGFPAFALAPLLREEFGDRLRLVQLTRHPVHVAASTVTHGWFDDGHREDIKDAIMVQPTDPGAKLPEYTDRWPTMTPFEKGLYFWYQVHSFGLEQEALSPPGTFLRVQFEKLVSDRSTQNALTAFLGLAQRSSWVDLTAKKIDKFQQQTAEPIDSTKIQDHPDIIKLALRLGYDPLEIDSTALQKRYQMGNRLVAFIKRAGNKAIRMLRGFLSWLR